MAKTIEKEIEFNQQKYTISIWNGHVWLELGNGVSTPLAMLSDPEGERYARLTSGVGISYKEIKIYSDGEVL